MSNIFPAQVQGNNLNAVTSPSVNDDITQGRVVGSVWVNVSSNPHSVYVCTDNTVGAAVWRDITGSLDINSLPETITVNSNDEFVLYNPNTAEYNKVTKENLITVSGAAFSPYNMIINGGFMYHQTKNGPSAQYGNWVADRWRLTNGYLFLNYTRPINDIPLSERISNRKLRMQVASTINETYSLSHTLEGIYTIPLRFNDFTISFWVRTNAPGKYYLTVAIRDTSFTNHSISVPYTVTTADVWQKITIVINSNSILNAMAFRASSAMTLHFVLNSTNITNNSNWTSGVHRGLNDQVNLFSTIGNYMELSQVCMTPGNYSDLPFRYYGDSIAGEQIGIKRYCESNFLLSEEPYDWDNCYFADWGMFGDLVMFQKLNNPSSLGLYRINYTVEKTPQSPSVLTRGDSYDPLHINTSFTRLDTYTNVGGIYFEQSSQTGFTAVIPSSINNNGTWLGFHWLSICELSEIV
jgi:hypothetical protein